MLLNSLNNDNLLCATKLFNDYIRDDENLNQFFATSFSSEYYDTYKLSTLFANQNKPLLLSLNIQSLNSKFEKLKSFIIELLSNNVKIDAILMQETWTILHPELLELPGFQKLIFRNRKNIRGGGVGIYIRKGLNFTIRNDLECFSLKTFENLVVEIHYPKKSMLFSNIYHSPNPPPNVTQSEHSNNFLELMDNHLANFSSLNKDCYVFLDANIDLLKMNSNAVSNDYMDINLSNGFIQLICKATRIQNGHFSLIDHILSNTNLPSYCSGTVVDDISDHFINFLQLPVDRVKLKPKSTFKRKLTDDNINGFKLSLAGIDWTDIYQNNDVDQSFDLFWTIFSDLYKIHFPEIKTKFNKNIHRINGYMTGGLLVSRKSKLELCKLAAKNRDPITDEKYKKFRNLYNTILRISKKMYFDSNFEIHKKNPKKTWDLLKEAASLNKSNDQIEEIIVNNETITDPCKIADSFNDFFSSIGTNISESIPPTIKKPEDYMPIIENLNDIDLGSTSQTHFCDIVKSLQPKCSLDSDGLSTKLLKRIALEISGPLAHIFNLSLQQGVFPKSMKKSRTVPIFKNGNSKSCDNYRPIALLSSLSKILEKMVSISLINHLNDNDILYKHQYGFQRNKSTEHNLIHAVNFIENAFNDNKYCIGVFFDLKKAFDVCSHDILLMKLKKMGVKGTALNWFKSYLSDRSQYVDINGHKSKFKKIKISILQGSILGPILFLIYINDLHLACDLFTVMFADDTFSLKSDKNLTQLSAFINIELNKMAIWFRANKLAVNKTKTKFIIFRSKGKKFENFTPIIFDENEEGCPFNPDLVTPLERYHDGHPNIECRSYKLLGVYLDEHLTLDYHVTHVSKKLAKSLYCIKMAKNNVNLSGLKSLYFALIHSHLSYCPIILNITSKSNLHKMEKVQKKAIRIITKSAYNAHTQPLFFANNILPLQQIIKQAKLKFMHSINYNYAPSSFNQTWTRNVARQGEHNLRNSEYFTLPIPRTEKFKKSPMYSLPDEWNKAGVLTLHENKTTFKFALKDLLLAELIVN